MDPGTKRYLMSALEDGDGALSTSRIISLVIALSSVAFIAIVLWRAMSPDYIGQVTTYATAGFGTTYGTGKIADALTNFAGKRQGQGPVPSPIEGKDAGMV
jgi:hypothetical protein